MILFSFGAPYYFDTTTISKFTAYYALYSKQPQFVDVAARLLFQELTPVGASPVSISAVGYDLISVMSPDPDQIIPLFLDLEPVPVATGSPTTPEPTPIPLFRIGDTIAIRTGAIMDNNGHPVPDGTVGSILDDAYRGRRRHFTSKWMLSPRRVWRAPHSVWINPACWKSV